MYFLLIGEIADIGGFVEALFERISRAS